ncbi:Succinylglutamate desuccinylase / Aspartoacylase family protein [Polystyrenella longa]|uniref:Succinylglutamate desuccinylase / Aspartoacylase family protein n=1 Tax=Polystyrenella longa TaxID=2528007 RepID=A0A518CJ98_9PLAN|nr:succinylglutamate desuccinylase/aspartoacylase family protein [Polystyrenella longa]QDU79305.1 Succinylglutamate desuccinylase / Aspartoacylase family protein [Polystyrenella longa]
MSNERIRKPIGKWNGSEIKPGESKNVTLAVSESYSGMTLKIPIHIRRAVKEGPTLLLTAALHGDEINGTGAIHRLMQDEDIKLISGAVIFVPVLNMLAFDRHSRYLPDRRDLNRSFPGSANGSLAGRMARTIFDELITRADYGIDLHTASVRRTNYPNVRGDLTNPKVKKLAKAFGCEIIMNGKGPKGALRREACIAGCPTIIMEGGEVWKVEPGIVDAAVRGIENVLRTFKMVEGEPDRAESPIVMEKSKWIRAERGGFLQFHIKPGDVVRKKQPLATNTTLLGKERSVLVSPFNAVVVGMTTLPAVSPGEPVCNLGRLPDDLDPRELRKIRTDGHIFEDRISEGLGSNVVVVEPGERPETN